MQTYIATLVNGLTNDIRQVKIESAGPELAHRDIYFKYADKSEEITAIVDESGDTLYTDSDGFSTMPDFDPGNRPEEIPVQPDVPLISEEEKEITI